MAFQRKRSQPGGNLGRAIRRIRRRRDLSQRELADLLHWPRVSIVQYERQSMRPRPGRLFDLFDLAVGEEETAPIITALEEQGIRSAHLSAVASTLHMQSAQQSPEVNP